MKPIIDWITGFFGFIVDMFAALFDLIAELIMVLVSCVAFIGKIVTALPLIFTIPVGILIVVCVLYKILGRETQS